MIQAEDARLAHYEQIITCYIDTLKFCGERAASLLRANPDQEPLGYFIPSVLNCGPLMLMRGLHQHAAQDRNRRSASTPSSSEVSAPKEQPVSLVRRLSQKYGDTWHGSGGKHPLASGHEAKGGHDAVGVGAVGGVLRARVNLDALRAIEVDSLGRGGR